MIIVTPVGSLDVSFNEGSQAITGSPDAEMYIRAALFDSDLKSEHGFSIEYPPRFQDWKLLKSAKIIDIID